MMKNKATHILTKIAVNIGRLLMAITFIFSGFVKGIDPLGTQYKITDYLEALDVPFMEHPGDVGITSHCRVCHRYLPPLRHPTETDEQDHPCRDERDDADYPVDRYRRPSKGLRMLR